MPENFDLSICICTFRRAEGLTRALDYLAALVIPPDCRVEIVVVDNDATESARAIVEKASAAFPVELRYFCEQRNGVSYARNRCVDESRGTWVAFVDDDEYVEANWLAEYWRLKDVREVDGMFGPVLAVFAETPQPWLLASGAHAKARYATGRILDWGGACSTCNVMFRRRLYDDVGGFDAQFARSGGEDCDFFWRCIQSGARFVWCDTALVHETIPAARMTREWVLTRAYRGGRTFAFMRRRYLGPASYVVDACRGLLSMLVYGPLALCARLMKRATSLKYERKVVGGFGKLLGWRAPPGSDYARGDAR